MKTYRFHFHQIETKRIFVYLALVFCVYYGLGLIAILLPDSAGNAVYSFLSFPVIFMGTPALSVFLTRRITGDKSVIAYSAKVWKNKKAALFSMFVPTVFILVGAVLFYLIFPNDLDYSGDYIIQTFGSSGAPSEISFTVPSLLIIGMVVCIISAFCVPSWFIALGEDIGWQGYLLPMLCKKMTTRQAVLLNGILWGVAHAPLIYFGMNFGLNYAGAPYSGIAMMTLFCMTIGVYMSYVTLKTNNCMYASIIHGAVNIIGETPIFISLSTQSVLLGPNPSGIIGMSVLLIGAVILLFKLPKHNMNS
ncbi:CPBP family intramembrane glutamic endopeptidase [Clostridioides difficile]|nr:CPBP family intramembrane metalloprotease [Clostridium sp. AF15-17LB]